MCMGECCKRCKNIGGCDEEIIAYRMLTFSDCERFEDDGSNECDRCILEGGI